MGDGFEAHDHDAHDHHAHDHDTHHEDESTRDLHIWMSPLNAKLMVSEISRALSAQYPDKRGIYEKNAEKITARLDRLDEAMRERMRRVSGKPFVVFHDAYQYFEKHYMLTSVGSLTVQPEGSLSAKRLSQIRAKIKQTGASCVFREPQFDGKVVDNLIEGTGARSGVLDPEGALLAPGPELYFS
jgi:zinc transport system substrate-binding protein